MDIRFIIAILAFSVLMDVINRVNRKRRAQATPSGEPAGEVGAGPEPPGPESAGELSPPWGAEPAPRAPLPDAAPTAAPPLPRSRTPREVVVRSRDPRPVEPHVARARSRDPLPAPEPAAAPARRGVLRPAAPPPTLPDRGVSRVRGLGMRSRSGLRRAVLAREVLGRPLALRSRPSPD